MRPATILIVVLAFCFAVSVADTAEKKKKKAGLIKKHLKRLRKEEGGIKLVGGRDEYEGNVEVLHEGQWGAVCDDDWDAAEARVVCRQLGYEDLEDAKPTFNSHFGQPKRKYWMDNIYCDGTEEELTACRFDGWGQNDCDTSEAAGVRCHHVDVQQKPDNSTAEKTWKPLPTKIQVRLRGGRTNKEGRVEIKTEDGDWDVICGDGWSLLEAMVVCRSLNLGYANDATQTDFFGGNVTAKTLSNIKCTGEEKTLSSCYHDATARGKCAGRDVATVQCTDAMADLIIDHIDLMRTAHLEDRQMFFLQCAMEENCLASQAYVIQKETSSWHLETRRLLKFTARILNAGTADFRPAIPKHLWEWHMCHMHYHSMEVFATFDIYNSKGARVAEGHKASFCLEDNQCMPGVEPRYACANFGDQGISVNCSDIYKYTVDCQWVDISDIDPGVYTLKVAINPEFKVPEITFENNAAYCVFNYEETRGTITNCTVKRP